MWSLGAEWAQQQAERGKGLSAKRPRQLLNCGTGRLHYCPKGAPDDIAMGKTTSSRGCMSIGGIFSHSWQRLPAVESTVLTEGEVSDCMCDKHPRQLYLLWRQKPLQDTLYFARH